VVEDNDNGSDGTVDFVEEGGLTVSMFLVYSPERRLTTVGRRQMALSRPPTRPWTTSTTSARSSATISSSPSVLKVSDVQPTWTGPKEDSRNQSLELDFNINTERDIDTESLTTLVKGENNSFKASLNLNLGRGVADKGDAVLDVSIVKSSYSQWMPGAQ
jgi:hypothetical protein